MKKVIMASHVATLNPQVPAFALEKDSIILVDQDGLETVVGSSALQLSPDGGRIFGGRPTDQHYQRMVRAVLAKGLGEGEHTVSVGLSAAKQSVLEFRGDRSSNALHDDATKALVSAISEIRYRVGTSDAPIKVCRVNLVEDKPVQVLYETEAVSKIMPPQAQSYLLFQIGSGDWQSVVVLDRKIMHHTHQRVQGIAGAENKLMELLNLSRAETKKAWISSTRPDQSLTSERVDCSTEKNRAARAHIAEHLPALLNSIEGLQDRIKAVVISGGAVHDEVFIHHLKQEIPSNLKPLTLHELQIADPESGVLNPTFACAVGISSQGVDVALDIGNSFLKAVFNV